MDVSAEAWRVKVANSKTRQDKKQKMKKPNKASVKSRNKLSIASICANTSANCCACIGSIADYIKEIMKCLFLGCRMQDTRFGEIVCELITISGNLCTDCINFVKCIIGRICDLQCKF